MDLKKRTIYKDVIIYQNNNIPDIRKNLLTIPLQLGVTATFCRQGRNVLLKEISFDRKIYNRRRSKNFCKKNNVSFYDTKTMGRRMIPKPDVLYDIGNHQFVAVTPEKTGKMGILQEMIV